eukprot:7782410-Alexandrium_andersonii.AAC.1
MSGKQVEEWGNLPNLAAPPRCCEDLRGWHAPWRGGGSHLPPSTAGAATASASAAPCRSSPSSAATAMAVAC